MGDGGKKRWRDLAELGNSPGGRAPEFEPGVDEPPDDVARRDFLRVMGASMALAGLGGCARAPSEESLPYTVQSPEVTPGVPSFYATASTRDGYATGLLVESHEGRPTKIEGNPDHPASLGASGVFEQASILGLYDPHRARGVLSKGEPSSWPALIEELSRVTTGRGLHLLLEPTSSPSIKDQLAQIVQRWPEVAVHYYAPLARSAAWEGSRMALGRPLETQIDLRAADVIVSLESDFLVMGPDPLLLSRQFADRRRVGSTSDGMNRLYVAEAALSVTGMSADHRVRLRSTEILALAASLMGTIGVPELGPIADAWRAQAAPHRRMIDAISRDLLAHRGASVVIAGDSQPAHVHAIAHVINSMLGNVGKTVTYTESPILDAGGGSHDLDVLRGALAAGAVETLVIFGGNPAYTAPVDFDFAARIATAGRSVYLGLYANETARVCTWSAPIAHELETWGDTRAMDGTVSVVQPLIEPLYAGRTVSEVLSVFVGDATRSARELLRDFWQGTNPANFEASWTRWLQSGIVERSALAGVTAQPAWPRLRDAFAKVTFPPTDAALEIVFRPDLRVYDGRFTNNAWLLELPDPVTKLTWGNAALISHTTAKALGVATEDVVELGLGGRTLTLPILVTPGLADGCISVQLGYGREGPEDLARGVGANAYRLRTAAAPYAARGVTVRKTGKQRVLAITQGHHSLHGREDDVLIATTLDEYRKDPARAETKDRPLLTLYQLRADAPRQWGMVIDQTVCTGCSACVVACQAENNVPIVGEKGVIKSREMHWLRIDRYFEGEPDEPDIALQPMLCQHCEMAPCEYVCPVNATVHSADGLNQMVYNRCVGTRFCSNNCPYKVRRFNWFNYTKDSPPVEQLVRNPDVTVRARGVMEKCTFCVQRIREHEIRAKVEGRPLGAGEIQTACQQACPTNAIVFGDLANPKAEVTKQRANDRAYAVLNDLNTRPRVRYLTKLKNPNPELT